jgi:ABC-type dipeptide/oligopeptide/nickel transport system permease subunit
MKISRWIAAVTLFVILLAAAWPSAITSIPYDQQFRNHPNAPMSRQFPLGTDELGRDRLSRVLHATRISMLAAPAAALVSMALAALAGGFAGFFGGRCDRAASMAMDLMLSLPWLFLLIIVRAVLPLNIAPSISLPVTFGLIALLGWPSAARVVRAGCRELRHSDILLQARASGLPPGRILLRHILPNLRPVLLAQFWAAIPIYILAEANLGLLGLGVADPLPSWGNLLRPLETAFTAPVEAWVPLVLLLVVVGCLYLAKPAEVHAR